MLDVARFVQSLFPALPIVHMPPTPQDPSNRRPDLTLMNQVLPGWGCKVSLEEGVERTIDWFRAELAVH